MIRKILVIVRNGLVEEVRSNVKMTPDSVIVMDLDGDDDRVPTKEQQAKLIRGYRYAVDPDYIDSESLEDQA